LTGINSAPGIRAGWRRSGAIGIECKLLQQLPGLTTVAPVNRSRRGTFLEHATDSAMQA
jgi:hypothetical protein